MAPRLEELGERSTLRVASRIGLSGTPHTSGDWNLSGWGVGASIAVDSTDLVGIVVITSGGSAVSPNPTATLTFVDGPFSSPPLVFQSPRDINGATGFVVTDAQIDTVTWTFVGTPAISTGYYLSYINFDR